MAGILIILTILLLLSNLTFLLLFLNAQKKRKELAQAYTTLRMFVRDVNFKTSPDLIKYTSEVFIQYTHKDIIFTYRNLYVPSGYVEVYKNGERVGRKTEAEIENVLSKLNKLVILNNVVAYYEDDRGFFKDVTELLRLLFNSAVNYDLLYSRAGTDQLTQLHNRLALDAYVQEVFPILVQNKRLSFMMFDIDDFKKFNDEYGHETGDIVLQRVAGAIRKNIKSSDFAFRFGGDEMAVIIEGDKYTAAKVAKRIVSSLQDNNDLKVTLSIGIAESEPEIDFDTLKRRADGALYAAKEKGKNKIVLWKTKTEENAVEEQK